VTSACLTGCSTPTFDYEAPDAGAAASGGAGGVAGGGAGGTTGHFGKASATFSLTMPSIPTGGPHRVFQIRNKGVSGADQSKDPGCFFGLLVDSGTVTLTLCGHAKPPAVAPMVWKLNAEYTFDVVYEVGVGVTVKVFEGASSTPKATVTHKPGATIYPMGDGLIVQLGGSVNTTGPRLTGAKLTDIDATLYPGEPWCPGFPAGL
jgi:hypothetical protein